MTNWYDKYMTVYGKPFAEVPEEADSIDSFMTQTDREMYADKNRFKYGRRKEDFEKEQNGR